MRTRVPALAVAVAEIVAIGVTAWWMSNNGFTVKATAWFAIALAVSGLVVVLILLPRPDMRNPDDLRTALAALTDDGAHPIWLLIVTHRSIAAGLLDDNRAPYTLQYLPSILPWKSAVTKITLNPPDDINRHTSYPQTLINAEALSQTLAGCGPTGHVVIQDSGRGQRATFAKQAKQTRIPAPGILRR